MKHIKIQTESDEFVHLDGCISDQTLCGLEQLGDGFLGFEKGFETNEKIDCPNCIRIILYCKSVRKNKILLNVVL